MFLQQYFLWLVTSPASLLLRTSLYKARVKKPNHFLVLPTLPCSASS